MKKITNIVLKYIIISLKKTINIRINKVDKYHDGRYKTTINAVYVKILSIYPGYININNCYKFFLFVKIMRGEKREAAAIDISIFLFLRIKNGSRDVETKNIYI